MAAVIEMADLSVDGCRVGTFGADAWREVVLQRKPVGGSDAAVSGSGAFGNGMVVPG